MSVTATKVVPLNIGLVPPNSLEARTQHWSKKSNELAFDLGDERGHLFGDCDPKELLTWLGEPDEIREISFFLGEPDGFLSRRAWIVLHFYDDQGRRFQSARTTVGKNRIERLSLTERSAALRISLRIDGKGTFRAIPIYLQTEPADQAVVQDHDAGDVATVKCVLLQVDAGKPSWLEAVPDSLKEELRSIAIRSRARSATRLSARLLNEIEVAQELLALDSDGEASEPGPWQAVRSAADDAVAAFSAAKRALTELDRQVDQAVASTGADRKTSDFGDLPRVSLSTPARAELAAQAAALMLAKGLPAAIATCLNNAHSGDQAVILEMLGEQLALTDPEAATRSFWFSWAQRQTPQRARTLAAKMFKAGDIGSAARLLNRADPDNETTMTRALKVAVEIARDGIDIPTRRPAPAPNHAVDDLAYVASAAHPFQTSGYTVRTQELLSALGRQGIALTCYVRPGYPFPELLKTDPENALSERYRIGDIPYVLTEPGSLAFTKGYFEAAAAALVRRFTERPPRLVQAASNHRNALPALIAARKTGVPFVYEVRGLWELTAASKNPKWETTERFRQERRLELTVASSADQVLTITQGVADELIASGVDASRIALLPNGVDPETFKPAPFDRELATSLGIEAGDCVAVYAGSLANYEGLDDVISAIGLLRSEGLPARFVIVGDGAMRQSLEDHAKALDITPWIHFAGSVPPDQVARYLTIASVIPIARKPFKVCEVVSPLKPFEAMAMAKPVIVSDLAALREIVTDGETGLVCAAADPASLANAMARLHGDRDLAARIGSNAREWIVKHRSWDTHAAHLRRIYDRF